MYANSSLETNEILPVMPPSFCAWTSNRQDILRARGICPVKGGLARIPSRLIESVQCRLQASGELLHHITGGARTDQGNVLANLQSGAVTTRTPHFSPPSREPHLRTTRQRRCEPSGRTLVPSSVP